MSDLYGKKMQAARAKLFAGELTKRLGFGLLFGLVVAGVSLWIFSPPGMVRNLWDAILTTIVVKVRELPMLGLRQEDVWEHAKALVFLKRFAPDWVKIFWTFAVSAGGMTVVLGAQFLSQNKGSHGLHYRRGSRLLNPVAHNVFMRLQYRKKPPHKMGTPLRLGVQKVIVPESLQ